MKTPTATWTWTCDRCGKRYPAEGLYALKVDAEQQWKWHRNQDCQMPLSQVIDA